MNFRALRLLGIVFIVSFSSVSLAQHCQDTFDAVQAAVVLAPDKAADIVANIAVKRDSNCTDGGIWVDQQLDAHMLTQATQVVLDVPVQCSASQVAVRAGVSGLPENSEFSPDMSAEQKAEVVSRLTDRVATILEKTSELQSRNGWEYGCTGVNLAAAMRGIDQLELRNAVYSELGSYFARQANSGFAAHINAYLTNYPATPTIRLREQLVGAPPTKNEVASPN